MSENTVFDFHRTLDLLVNIIARVGFDHKARKADGTVGCIYMSKDGDRLSPVCIVGQVFADLGILRALFLGDNPYQAEPDQETACTTDAAMWSRAEANGVVFDHDARLLLRAVQNAQDSGNAWGDALPLGLLEGHRFDSIEPEVLMQEAHRAMARALDAREFAATESTF